MTAFTRQNPSPRYIELLTYYREMHQHGAVAQNVPPENTFDGRSMPPHAEHIRTVISVLGSQTILDYGSGKGKQYGPMNIETTDGKRFKSIGESWGIKSITCFDPGHEPFSTLPEGTFDGVVTTDVLEHCPKEDLPWIIDEVFNFATEFVYVNVACYPASKTLPNGENAHCTVEPPQWWIEHFDRKVHEIENLRYFAAFDVPRTKPDGSTTIDTLMHRGKWNA